MTDAGAGPDRYLEGHIRQALAEDTRVGELGVEVTLAAGGVYLTGDVASEQCRDAIADVVHEVAPDREVHNQTAVTDYPEPEEAEQL